MPSPEALAARPVSWMGSQHVRDEYSDDCGQAPVSAEPQCTGSGRKEDNEGPAGVEPRPAGEHFAGVWVNAMRNSRRSLLIFEQLH
jgi:hypothetical protein